MASPGNIPPSLEADFVALRKLRDESECDELKQAWSAEDPTQWECEIRGEQRSCVGVEDGRVVGLGLSFSSLAELPAAIGGLDALKVLDLSGCSSLEKLPDAVAAREGLKVTLPYHLMILDIQPPLREDLVALRKLRDDDASGELKKSFAERYQVEDEQGHQYQVEDLKEDPREWNGVMVTDGRVTGLSLQGCGEALPASIGELKALTRLDLSYCGSLATLPDAIGELGALTELYLVNCWSLVKLPDAIGGLRALTTLKLESCSSLVALPAAIGGLRALTTLKLESCSSLVALPAAIGELDALTELVLYECSSLDALPESIAGLDALEQLNVDGCNLKFPPQDVVQKHGDTRYGISPWDTCRGVKRLLANMTRFLDGDSTAIDEPDVKTGFFEGVLQSPSYANRLEDAVRKNPALADLTNEKGQRAVELACLECRRAMQKALFFLNRYDIADGPPEHRSATSLVVRAVDVAADYGRLFDEFDKDSSGVLNAGEIKALAVTLGTTVETFKLADGGGYTRDAFVARFGKERKVVIKIFQSEEQWRNEKRGREDQQLDARYVVQTIPAPTDDEFAKALGESVLFGEGVGSHAIVMDAADRNLFQIYQTELPDLNKVRVLMRETMECVQHLHEKGLVHGDLKMLNVVRLSLDNRLRLIDLDAAAKISVFGGDVSYVGSKFSSAVLPPECFAKLDADQVAQFEAYFSDCDAELQRKVEPKVDRRGASYVVKTFNLTENGAPKDGLPYELVEASVAVDYWSLGVLLYQLVAGEPFVPSNRDDDCVDSNAMAALACWDDNAAKKYLGVIKDAAAWDLASKLLVRDPVERATFSIADALARHPFFNPESGDPEIQRQLDAIQTTLNAVKADTSTILSLSGALELQNLGNTLRNGIEATEVTTPTVFVILKEKLKTKEELRLAKTVEGKLALERKEGDDDVVGRLEEAKTWTTILADFGSGALKCSPSEISAVVQKACEELVVGEEMFLYLIDELTLEPVRPESEDDVYPIKITTPAEIVSKLLPAMQIGLYAMSVVNGAAGIARLFGVPAPRVSDEWRAGVATSVEILKQESSVEAFSAVNTTATGDDTAGKKHSLRGAALRDLKRLLENKDPDHDFAGLRRIGDPSDGTAVWTLLLDTEKVTAALEMRAAERRAAEKISRKLRPKTLSSVPVFTSSKIEIRKGDKDLKAQAINDAAVGGIDRYESAPLAAALVDVLDSVGPPVCVGLLAKWGSGKSFLIHQLKRHFDPYARETPTHQLVQWFEEARDGRDAYAKLSPSEREKVEQRISDRKPLVVVDEEDKAEVIEWFAPLEAACLRASDDDNWATPLKDPDTSEHLSDEQKTWIKNKVAVKDRPDQSYRGVLACLLLPLIFCLKLGANSWRSLKPYWVDTACNILLDAWRAFTGFRTHYRDSVDLMHNLHIPPPETVTGRRQILLPSPPIDIESQPQSQREYIFVDFNVSTQRLPLLPLHN